MNDPALELRFDMDRMDAVPVVEQVSYVSNDNVFEIDETIEVSYVIDRHQPAYNLIQPIRSEQYADLIELEEENLEINVEKDLQEIKIAEVIQTIPLTLNEEILELDDALDLDFSVDMITPVKLVEQVTTSWAISDLDEINEELELDFSMDVVEPIAQIEPVMANVEESELEIMDEQLEVGTNDNVSETAYIYPLIKPIYNEKLTHNEILITDPELEINNDMDLMDLYPLVNPVEVAMVDMVDDFEENLEINLNIDNTILEKEAIAAINLLNKRLESESVTSMPAIGVELFYLRETLEIAKDIETSRTDFEMLTLALTDPTDLSYEELLFAASIAQNPKEKLKIFYQAFIHIDRDWRAFNNAAISAINIHDLETAECFLYQASLISDSNGKILNNMGILACYLNDFEKAKDHFITAGTYGVNSEYNLQVVQNIYNANSDTPSNFRQELGDHRYYEVLGDASELNEK
jgi:hypothetical protein